MSSVFDVCMVIGIASMMAGALWPNPLSKTAERLLVVGTVCLAIVVTIAVGHLIRTYPL